MKPIITVKGIGKKYIINHQRGGYVALRDVIANIFKNPFAHLQNKAKEEFWALKDVNFEVMPGEVVGIIGRNGAGKSTLLKILSQITPPTTGEIKINGRVGSLLEVGTGFHPELTGRENIFLNGAILGMKKKEIVQKFAKIVAFADIDKFLDTPVKYYSSGMYVRLAFSVAAHMDPDILIIDEVLAVGDADFQKKCLGKMNEITKEDGRTILFVSHNTVAIKELCQKVILIEKGSIKLIGKTADVIEEYLQSERTSQISNASSDKIKNRTQKQEVQFTDIKISTASKSSHIKSNDRLCIQLYYTSKYTSPITGVRIVITITNLITQQVSLRLDSDVTAMAFNGILPHEGAVECQTDTINLIEGNYLIDIDFLINGTSYDYVQGVAEFHIETNLESYDYRLMPDKSICNNLVSYNFKELSAD